MFNNVNVSILSMVSLAGLINDATTEMRMRLDGLSNPEDNLRELLVTDAMGHGLSEAEANQAIEDYIASGFTVEDIARKAATEDAAVGQPSFVLPNPDPGAVLDESIRKDLDDADLDEEEIEAELSGVN